MKPALCIVNPFEHGGGAEYQISLLIDALAAAGTYDVHYLAHFLDQRATRRGYRVARIGKGGGIPKLGYLMEAGALYRALRSIAPCAIYQRVASAYTGICAAYARQYHIPLLWHVAHDTDVMRQSLDSGRNVLRVRLEKWATNFGARRADHIIVQSAHQARLLKQNFSRDAAALVPNFHPAAEEAIDKTGVITVVWIANLKPWKRPEVFVRLASAFRDRADMRFVMVGAPTGRGSNQRWQAAILEQIRVTGNLEYLGHRSHDEVNGLLARAHYFVNTSTAEGFPNTFVQAWLRDAVVLSLDVDPDGVLENEHLGILARSEAGLESALRRMLNDPTARADYIARGRRHAQAHHSMRNAADLMRLIDRASSRAH